MSQTWRINATVTINEDKFSPHTGEYRARSYSAAFRQMCRYVEIESRKGDTVRTVGIELSRAERIGRGGRVIEEIQG